MNTDLECIDGQIGSDILSHATEATNNESFQTNNAEQLTSAQAGRPFTKRELSNFLGISERFIELEVNRDLRAVKLSNRLLRFRPIDVERWMESHLVGEEDGSRYALVWIAVGLVMSPIQSSGWTLPDRSGM
ncbi:MAG TPA: hypothetical protein VE860_19905 [Chthoniobacterales bacterium]|jgi:predicted DNA-binding transcriptional regulator AlpA|nr:hypothetical protein [Chthoniobacterales bacterium]